MSKTKLAAAAVILMAGTLGAANVAYAFDGSPMDRAELQQLSPGLRHSVEQRLGEGQSVRGILETMLLNRVEDRMATKRIVAIDFDSGEVVVEGMNGQIQAYPFNKSTLQIG